MANIYIDKQCITVADGAMSEFCSKYKEVNAGGGLVKNGEGKFLVIFRRGVWDLPKGKQEEGEKIEECALREVNEETGLNGLVLGSPICITHHTYKLDGQPVLKHTHWFNMDYAGSETPTPQLEEEITGVRWVSAEELPEIAQSTFPSLTEVFASVIEGL
ncbi:MAG: NUDIX domain-containing protein [Bacteroidales bacterium]|nr:NUDIX domain-containing protein [Candidatus Cacconaster caballi]